MINLLMFYLLIGIPFGAESAVDRQFHNVTKVSSEYCERLYVKNSMGQGAWRTVCIPHINTPDIQTKGCPELIAFTQGHSGCLLSYLRAYSNKEYSFIEVLKYVHAEAMDMRADHV